MEFQTDIFTQYDKKWALVTAGRADSFNTMTISWGGLGTIWGKPVATVYIRPSRYTLEFLDREETFTISWYPEQYRAALALLGKKSGRDGDKVAEAGLTPKEVGNTMTFEEAETTMVCKKLYRQVMEPNAMPKEARDKYYVGDDTHVMFIAEVVEILSK